jgi:hypothetical protein
MAGNTKISQLGAGAPALASDLLPIARAGANYSLQVSDIARQTETFRASYTVTSTDVSNQFFIIDFTWPAAFLDTNYTVVTGLVAGAGTQFYSKVFIQNKTATGARFAVVGEEFVTVASVNYTVDGTMLSEGDVWECEAISIHD